MRLEVLLILLPLVLGGAIPGEKKCSWGPSYWCSHVSHARECGATQHCLETVWKNQLFKPKSTETCTYCELIVNEFRNALQDKTTEDEIAHILVSVCAILPNPDVRTVCEGVITDYAPELLQMFAEDVSTDTICAVIGFCSGLVDGESSSDVKANNGSDCQDCKKFLADIQADLSSQEFADQIIQLFDQILCDSLGSFSGLCDDFIKQYIPVVLQTLADQLDPDISCRIFGFCDAGWKHADTLHLKNVFQARLSTKPLTHRSSEECDVCKDFLTQVVEVIRDKDNQDKIIAEAKSLVCDQLGSLANQCKELVDEYAPMLFELLVNELDPVTLCEAIGLCQAPGMPKYVKAATVEPASMVGPGYVRESVECTVCKLVLQQVDNFLKENGTIKDIEDLIDKVCDRLPSDDLKKQCLAFVNEYGPLVVNLLAQELDPKVTCAEIKLCKSAAKPVLALTDAKCDLCVEFVSAAEKAVENISTEVLMNDLKAICSYIPGNYSQLCLDYVKQYGSLIINFLKSKEDPRQLCTLVQMCTSSHAPVMTVPIPEVLPQAEPSEECKVCDTVVFVLKNLLSENATEEEIKQLLEKICSYVPSEFTSICNSLIEQYGDRLIQLLLQHLDAKTICTDLGLCEAVEKPLVVSAVMSPYDTLPLFTPKENKKVEAGPTVECEVCDTVVFMLKTLLSDNATEEEVKQLLEKICAYVPASYSSSCSSLIEQYGDRLIELLLQHLDAKTICTDLGLCKPVEKPLVVSAVMSPYDTLPLLTPKENKEGDNGVTCEICEYVIGYVDKQLQNNRTEAAIKAELEKVCSELSFVKTECDELVDKYLQVLINYLVLAESPDKICKEIGLCPSTVEKELPKPVHVKLLKDNSGLKSTVGGPECTICEFVMKELDKLLKDNKSEAAIEEALDKVCSLMPDTVTKECKEFVSKYAGVIINLLVNSIASPDEVCAKLGLCGQKIVQPTEMTSEVEAGPLCVICEYVMERLDKILAGNRTEAAVREALDKVCSFMPDTIANECEDFVNKYTDMIINLLVKSLADPSEVCRLLTLCTSENYKPWGAFVNILPEKPKVGVDNCEICQLLVEQIQNFLKENKTQQELEEFLKKVCSYLPDTVTVQCDEVMDTYLKAILSMIDSGYTPKQICQAIQQCPAMIKPSGKKDDDTLFFKPHQKLVGQKKCTYGPSYWCASKENAAECNAVEHCMRHVWN